MSAQDAPDYLSAARSGIFEQVINKSKFITAIAPASTQEDAAKLLYERREAHPGATHHCSAYILGFRQDIQRFSDDGEPSGTAGMPMLEVMKKRGLTRVAAVVTRYYGGIPLGAGGLVRAYSGGVKLLLDEIGVASWVRSLRIMISAEYALIGKLENYFAHAEVIREDADFGADVSFTLLIREVNLESVTRAVQDIASGRAEVITLENLHYPWESGKA